MTPVIGITAYDDEAEWRKWQARAALLPYVYVNAVRRGGGRPVLLPPGGDGDEARETIAGLDGLVVSGGPDIDPARYGKARHPRTQPSVPVRDAWDLAVTGAALTAGVPVLAICRGMQVLNVSRGGTLHQHVPDLVGHDVHSGPADGFGVHKVRVTAGELLASILPSGDYFEVPTHHHQAIDLPGAGLTAVAWADDGVIEAIEAVTGFTIGVQWHPEQGTDERLFAALIQAAELRNSERAVEALPAIPNDLPELLADA